MTARDEKFIDSNYLNTDILDCRIKKLSLNFAEVRNYLSYEAYALSDIPATSIKFWNKDIADFTMDKPMNLNTLSAEELCASKYGRGISMDTIGQGLNPQKDRRQVSRWIRKYLRMHFQELKKRDLCVTRVGV
ncbi:MAG: hypothetical protein OEY88_01565 [Candidatus Bathyarchaeota archaeon]|nr:hypothetical protein [Candidatus Bathyarchaeota archaeon]